MIIVEGPDGAGKSTLVNKLSHRLGLEIAPRVVSKDTTHTVDLREWVDNNLDKGFDPYTIYDRHRLISDTIYRTALRKPMAIDLYDRDWLTRSHRRFADISPVIIWCLPPYETVAENLKNDPDNTAVQPQIEQIYHSYVATMAQYLAAPQISYSLLYDYTRDVNGAIVNDLDEVVARYIDRRENYMTDIGSF